MNKAQGTTMYIVNGDNVLILSTFTSNKHCDKLEIYCFKIRH